MKTINPFRNEAARRLYDEKSRNQYVYECGIDNNGKVYFAWLNGNVERYTRKEFIKIAEEKEEY